MFSEFKRALYESTSTTHGEISKTAEMDLMDTEENNLDTHTIQARFVSDTGEEAGPPFDLPVTVDVQQLELICNALLKNVSLLAKYN